MTKKSKAVRDAELDAQVLALNTHVCIARVTLTAILEACDAAASGSPEAPILALDTIRALVTPYTEV